MNLGDVAWINGDEGQMAKADNTITKADIQNWIDENRIEVEEVELGEGNSWGVYEISSGGLVKSFNSKEDAQEYASRSSKYEIRSNDRDRGIEIYLQHLRYNPPPRW